MSTRRRFHNAPEAASLNEGERAELEAARGAWVSIRKTFENWITIGRGLQTLRRKADEIGGRKTFQRLLQQEGLGDFVKAKARATRLLRIMEHLSDVYEWHERLASNQRINWASPEAVIRNCPVFKKSASQAKRKAPTTKVKRQLEDLYDENGHLRERLAAAEAGSAPSFDDAINVVITELLKLPKPKRVDTMFKLFSALHLRLTTDFGISVATFGSMQRSENRSAKKKSDLSAGKKLPKVLNWVQNGDSVIETGEVEFVARLDEVREYRIRPTMAFSATMPFAGYQVTYYPTKKWEDNEQLGSTKSLNNAKKIAQKHYDERLKKSPGV